MPRLFRFLVATLCCVASACASTGYYGLGWHFSITKVKESTLPKQPPVALESVELFWLTTPEYAFDVIEGFIYEESRLFSREDQPIDQVIAGKRICKKARTRGANVVIVKWEYDDFGADYSGREHADRHAVGVFARCR
jgi:hypothetical protein